MRNRFYEPRSDPPSPRRLDDVNVNKSLYGNKRETPSIRCHESSRRPGTASPTAHRPDRGAGRPTSASTVLAAGCRGAPSEPGAGGSHASRVSGDGGRYPRYRWDGGRAAVRMRRQTACDLGVVPEGTGRASRIDAGLAGHVRLLGNVAHRNPSASDIHPRNRTRAGYVSLGTDDAIQDHRTGPGAIPRSKEGKDGC